MSSVVNLRERGWSQGIYVAVASAVAAGKLLGLTEIELGHAVSLALVPQIPLRQTRAGELSMWKGCARDGQAASMAGSAATTLSSTSGVAKPAICWPASWNTTKAFGCARRCDSKSAPTESQHNQSFS
jgi:2-methylcitrate dehydratase